jgi:hypothetical protein
VCLKCFPCPWYIRHKPCTYHAPRLTLYPNRPKWAFTWPTPPRSTIECVQNDFWAYGTFGANRAPNLCLDLHHLQMDRNKLPLDPCHLGVSSGVPKMISMPVVLLMQTMCLSCVKINTISKQTKIRFPLTHVTRSTIGIAQNDFHTRCTLGANHTPILRRD